MRQQHHPSGKLSCLLAFSSANFNRCVHVNLHIELNMDLIKGDTKDNTETVKAELEIDMLRQECEAIRAQCRLLQHSLQQEVQARQALEVRVLSYWVHH